MKKTREGRAGGDKERAELAKVPKSKVLVPQTAMYEWNLDARLKRGRAKGRHESEPRGSSRRGPSTCGGRGPETVRLGEVRPSKNPKLENMRG